MRIYIYLSLLAFGLVGSVKLKAQNYRPFQANWTYLFACEYYPLFGNGSIREGLYAMKVDSTAADGSDSLFYFNQIGRLAFDGVYPNQDNIFGRYMRESPNGEYAFHSSAALTWISPDTYYIKTQVPLQSSWVYHINDGGDSIIATLAERGIRDFLGITDSIIKINISTGNSLVISKNYGFLDARALFPVYIYSHQLRTRLQLAGIENLDLGQRRPRLVDFYDYDIGDVFMNATSGVCDSYVVTRYNWTRILGRNTNATGDSIHYKIQTDIVEIWPPDPSPTNDWDTIHFGPDTSSYSVNIGSTASDFPSNYLSHDFKGFQHIRGPFRSPSWGNRWTYRIEEYFGGINPVTLSYNSIKSTRLEVAGIGSTQYFAYFAGYYGCLQCAQKQNGTFGNGPCFSPTTVANDPLSEPISIILSPNPASDYIDISLCAIKLLGQWSLEIYDSFGERLHTKSGQNQLPCLAERLEIGFLPSGVYYLTIKGKASNFSTKFVKY